jgi:membrane-anchored glycerophosphoryl diester phosphodiesterase (GDPDase)
MKTSLSISKVFSNAWQALRGNLWVLVGLLIAYIILSFTLSTLSASNAFLGFIVGILSLFIATIYSLGFARICLDALNGDEPQFSSFKDQIPNFWKGLGMTFLVGVAAVIWICLTVLIVFSLLGVSTGGMAMGGLPDIGGAGILLLLALQIPLIYAGVRLQFALFLIVDKGCGVISSLKGSWDMTGGHIVPLLALLGIQIVLIIAGTICLIVGLFPAAVLCNLVVAAAYNELKPAEAISE